MENTIYQPDIGTVCEARYSSCGPVWHKARIVGYDDGRTIGRWLDGPKTGVLFDYLNYDSVRPIKTDAEKFRENQISSISKIVNHHLSENNDDVNGMGATLYDYGCRIPKNISDADVNTMWKNAWETNDAINGFAEQINAFIRGESC